MTKKEDLLQFIQANCDETNMLRTIERVMIPAENQELLMTNDIGYKRFKATKEHLTQLITDGFDDNLIGSVGTDPTVVKILDWWTETEETPL